jgi:23S rRNA (uracil1939-C5)-methyltransferase
VGTSGVCLFATAPEHVEELRASVTETRYVALARGITNKKGIIARALLVDGVSRDAKTRYRRTRVEAGHSLLDVRIETGRTHQIRRHLAMIGHPVLGDERHGDGASNRYFTEKHGLDRPFLHCARMVLGELVLEAPLPGELDAVLRSI